MVFAPTHIYYLLSKLCNERCSKCDHWQASDHPPMPAVEQVIELVRTIPSARELCLVGGEPLLHVGRVMSLLDGIADTDIRTTIMTNVTTCTPRFLDRVRDLNVHVVFSIDTLDSDFWLFVRGKPTHGRVMAHFDHARRTLAAPKLSVQSVLALETAEHVAAVGEMCRRHGIHHSVQDYVQDGFNGRWTSVPAAMAMCSNDSRCYAAGRSLSIMPDGTVFTCFQQPLIEECSAPLGRTSEHSAAEMLNSPYTARVLRRMRTCNLPCKVLKCNRQP